MFTPMQWKRIIHGLVQCVAGMVTEIVQRRHVVHHYNKKDAIYTSTFLL